VSFADFFKDADALHNLGVGYESVSGDKKIRVERKEFFYDSSSNSVNLNGVNGMVVSTKKDIICNSITIGYSKWQLSAGGSLIDDPQTQHTYSTPWKYVGKPLSILCGWIAASLLFELTRRAILKQGETYDTDNDIFVLKIDGTAPDLAYVGSSNLLDPDYRYNKTLTPGRNFLRSANIFNIGHIAGQYVGDFFKFVSGLGNFLTSVEIDPDSCPGTDVAEVIENSDVEITGDALHGIEVVQFENHPLTWDEWKLIRDNKNKTIGVSETNSDHIAYFIDTIQFYKFEKKANFVLFRGV
jgi:hypothetical protein